MILQPVVTQAILDFLGSDRGKELALTPTLTSDHLVRTKALPLWIENPDYNDLAKLREQLVKGITAFGEDYQAYLARNAALMPPGMKPFDALPRVVLLPGLGALCAGKDAHAARIAHDITVQTLAAKARIAAMGTYHGLAEDHLFEVEYFTLQHAKLKTDEPPLGREVAIVTGASRRHRLGHRRRVAGKRMSRRADRPGGRGLGQSRRRTEKGIRRARDDDASRRHRSRFRLAGF